MDNISDIDIRVVKWQHHDVVRYFVILINVQLIKYWESSHSRTYISKEHIKSPKIWDIFISINFGVTIHNGINDNFMICISFPPASLYRSENIYIPNSSSINQCSSMQLHWGKDPWNRRRSKHSIRQLFSIFHFTPIKDNVLCRISICCWNENLSLQIMAFSKLFQIRSKRSIVVNTSLIEDSLDNPPRPALQNIWCFNTTPFLLYLNTFNVKKYE